MTHGVLLTTVHLSTPRQDYGVEFARMLYNTEQKCTEMRVALVVGGVSCFGAKSHLVVKKL